ncbi:MAG: anti-sigma factor family protein [Candidatus Heteroscillospira sp.]
MEMISAMLDGELTDAEREALETHIYACPDCRRAYDAFSAMSENLREPAPVPENFSAGVMAHIRAPKQRKVIPWRRWGALAACLVLVCSAAVRFLPLTDAADGAMATAMGQFSAAEPESCVAESTPEAPEAANATAEKSLIQPTPMPFSLADRAGYIPGALEENLAMTEEGSDMEALLENLSWEADAQVPDTTPAYTVELPAGSLAELWETDGGIVCRLDGFAYVPGGNTQTIIELVKALSK